MSACNISLAKKEGRVDFHTNARVLIPSNATGGGDTGGVDGKWLLWRTILGEWKREQGRGGGEGAKTLGLKRSATQLEIKSAYLDLVKELHPDRHHQTPLEDRQRNEARFKNVQQVNVMPPIHIAYSAVQAYSYLTGKSSYNPNSSVWRPPGNEKFSRFLAILKEFCRCRHKCIQIYKSPGHGIFSRGTKQQIDLYIFILAFVRLFPSSSQR
eukprot:748558-Hanusia_phi.AAC.1